VPPPPSRSPPDSAAAAAAEIVAARQAKGPFRSLFDFCERVDSSQVNRATIETLIKAGAFDSLEARRSQLAAVLDRAVQGAAAKIPQTTQESTRELEGAQHG
jgi:DNA polymerase III alpha subunit